VKLNEQDRRFDYDSVRQYKKYLDIKLEGSKGQGGSGTKNIQEF